MAHFARRGASRHLRHFLVATAAVITLLYLEYIIRREIFTSHPSHVSKRKTGPIDNWSAFYINIRSLIRRLAHSSIGQNVSSEKLFQNKTSTSDGSPYNRSVYARLWLWRHQVFFLFVSTQQRNTISKKKQKTCASGGCIVYRRKIWKQVQAKGQKAFKRVVAFPSITADREKEKRVYSHSAHLVSFKFSVYLYLVYRSGSYI